MKRRMRIVQRCVFGFGMLVALMMWRSNGLSALASGSFIQPDEARMGRMAAAAAEIAALEREIVELAREIEEWEAEGYEGRVAKLRERRAELEDELAMVREWKEEQARGRRQRAELLEELEVGMRALRELGREKELKMLMRVSREVRAEMRGGRAEQVERDHEDAANREIEVLRMQVETLGMAAEVLREAEKGDAVEALERAIHPRRLRLEVGYDEKVQVLMRESPGREDILYLLGMATEWAQEMGMDDRAEHLARMRRELWGRPERERGRKEERQHRMAVTARHLEIMESALPALREAGRADAVELLERAIHARKMDMAGREDRESMEIREAGPGLGAEVEILGLAARLWRNEFDNAEKAEPIEELTAHLRQQWEAERKEEREWKEGGGGEASLANQVEEMRVQMREMEEMMDHLARELEEMREHR